MTNRWLGFAGLFGFLGVASGAFGAHALEDQLDAKMMATFKTASHYCLVHASALLGVAALSVLQPSSSVRNAGWFFVFGIAIFSGTLWALVLTGHRWLGAITPIGGTALIIGWALLVFAGWRKHGE